MIENMFDGPPRGGTPWGDAPLDDAPLDDAAVDAAFWEALCAGDPLADVWAEFPVDEPPADESDISVESRGAAATARVMAQLLADEDLDSADLIEVIAHCRATVAAANYRMLQAASLLHDIRAEEYGLRLAEASGSATGECTSEQMEQIIASGVSGHDPLAEYGPDGLQQAIADVGATLSMHPTVARALILSGYATRYRLPVTAAHALATGRIDLQRFQIAQRRTELVDPDKLAAVDERLATAILSRDHMSTQRFTDLVDSIVAKVDAEAIKQRRRRAAQDRKVSVRPDHRNPGQSQMNASLPLADGALIDARLTDMAAGVHPGDPRTATQRRADALIALSEGLTTLGCRCDTCAAEAHATDAGTSETPSAEPAATPDVDERHADLADFADTEADNTDTDATDTDTDTAITDTGVAPSSNGANNVDSEASRADAQAADTDTDTTANSADTEAGITDTKADGAEESDSDGRDSAATPGATPTPPPCTCTCDHHGPPPTPPPSDSNTVAPTRTVIHVVANQSTLDGTDDAPAYLDGFGVLDAESARELAAQATTRLIGVDPARIVETLATMRYRPGKGLQAFVRTGELCCTFPGCNNPVWLADLDHTRPFDHADPTRGGPTHHHNLKPLCRFHHRIKTFTAWRDFQDHLGTVTFTSPTGHTFTGNAFRGTDLFPALTAQPPEHPSRREVDTITTNKRAANTRAHKRWNDENPPPF